MTKSAKRNVIVSAVLAIVLCISLLAGATFALFTSTSSVNIAVTSGKVKIVATVDENSLKTYSGKDLIGDETDQTKIYATDSEELGGTNGTFINGGTAEFKEGVLELSKMTPGDKVTFEITVTNYSTVKTMYRTIIACKEDNGLFDGLKITTKVGETETVWDTGFSAVSAYTNLEAADGTQGAQVGEKVTVSIELPSDAGNEYQTENEQTPTGCTISYIVEAIQGNAADTKTLYLYSEHDMFAFAKLYNEQSSESKNWISDYQLFKLMSDVTLTKEWTPIDGLGRDGFRATFDGNDKTIYNLKIADRTEERAGLFGSLKSGGTVKNLNLVNAQISSTNSYVGGIAGCSNYGCFIENCTIDSTSYIKGLDNVGGFIGSMARSYTYRTSTLTNCTNAATVEATHESGEGNTQHAGGLVGQVTGNESIKFEGCRNVGKIITKDGNVGGILGTAQGPLKITIDNCSNESLSESAGIHKGDLIGWIAAPASNKVFIDNCTIDENSIGIVSGGVEYTITVDGTENKIDVKDQIDVYVAFSEAWWGKTASVEGDHS